MHYVTHGQIDRKTGGQTKITKYLQQPPTYTLQQGLITVSEWHTHWKLRWIEPVVTIQHKNNQCQHKVAETTIIRQISQSVGH